MKKLLPLLVVGTFSACKGVISSNAGVNDASSSATNVFGRFTAANGSACAYQTQSLDNSSWCVNSSAEALRQLLNSSAAAGTPAKKKIVVGALGTAPIEAWYIPVSQNSEFAAIYLPVSDWSLNSATPQEAGGTVPPTSQQPGALSASTGSACEIAANKKVTFMNSPASMTASRGSITVSIVKRDGVLHLGGVFTNFPGEAPQSYQSGKIRGGSVVLGDFRLSVGTGSSYPMSVTLKSGGSIPIGTLVDDTPGTAYPHRGHVELNGSTCVTQYTMDNGSGMVSAGNGYIVLP